MARKLLAFSLTLFCLVVAIGLLAGCGEDEPPVIIEPEPEANTVKLRPDRLPTLLEALVYEGWIVKVDISAFSHPFFTGKQKLVDTEGRVDRFNKRYAAKK